MPNYRVDPTGKRRPKKIKATVSKESRVEELLIRNPSLLPHRNKVVWFDKSKNGPGDLAGLDRMGRRVIVEVKKKLGKGEQKKASSQVQKRARKLKDIDRDEVERLYQRYRKTVLKDDSAPETFADAFQATFGKKLNKKSFSTDEPSTRYIVFDHATKAGSKAARATNRRRKRPAILVSIQVLHKSEETGELHVAVEKFT